MNSEKLKQFIGRAFCVTDSELEVLRFLLRELDMLEFSEQTNREVTENVG